MRDNRSGLIIKLEGDRAAATKLIGYGRVLLSRMNAALAGQSGAKRWRVSDGVEIRTIQAGAISILQISVAAGVGAGDEFNLLQGVLLHVSHDYIPLSFEGEDIPAVIYQPDRDRYLFGNSQVSTAERKGSYRAVADHPYAGNRMWVGLEGHILSWDGADIPFPIERTFTQDHSENFGLYFFGDDPPVPPSREVAAKHGGLTGFYYRGLPVETSGLLDQDEEAVGRQINGAAFIEPPTDSRPGLLAWVSTSEALSRTGLYIARFYPAQRREQRHRLSGIRRLASMDWLQWDNANVLATVFFRQDGQEAVGTIFGGGGALTKVRASIDVDDSPVSGVLELDGAAGSFSQNTLGDHAVTLQMPYFTAGSDDERFFGITLDATDRFEYRGDDRYTYGTASWGETRTTHELLTVSMGAVSVTLAWSDVTTLDIAWDTGNVPGTVYPGENRKEDALTDYDSTREATLITDLSLTSLRPEIEAMVLEWAESGHVSDHQFDFESEDAFGDGDVVFKRGDARLEDENSLSYHVRVVAGGEVQAASSYGPVTESGVSTYASEDGPGQFDSLFQRYETESRPVDHGGYNPPSPYPPVPNFSTVSASLARQHHAAFMRFRFADQQDASAEFAAVAPSMRGQNMQIGCLGAHSAVVALADAYAYRVPVAMMASQTVRSDLFGLSPTDPNPVASGASWTGSLPLDMGVESSDFSPLYLYLL